MVETHRRPTFDDVMNAFALPVAMLIVISVVLLVLPAVLER